MRPKTTTVFKKKQLFIFYFNDDFFYRNNYMTNVNALEVLDHFEMKGFKVVAMSEAKVYGCRWTLHKHL